MFVRNKFYLADQIKLCIFIIKGFRTIVFIFITISTTFRPICPPAFLRCLSNSGTFTELRTTSFIESMEVTCSDSVSHNRVQVLSIPVLLLACSRDWICKLQIIVSLGMPITVVLCVLLDSSQWILETYKHNVLTCLGLLGWSSVESTEKDIETRLTKAWTAINRLSIIWKSDLTDKMKRSFFQAAVTSILLYGCTTWTLTKRLEKNLDGNYTRMLRAILNKSWRQHPTKTIQVRRTRHARHCWRSRDELIRDVLLWTATHGRAKAGRPARTYIQQLCEDTGCCPEDLPRAMNDWEEWRERVRDIRATSATWWWWLLLCMIFYLIFIFCFSYSEFFSRLAFLVIGSHFVIISILGLLNRSL